MADETSKSSARRLRENPRFWQNIFMGMVLDVGSGGDPLKLSDWPNILKLTTFDLKDGDGNFIDNYFLNESFDLCHSSNFIEHTQDPLDVICRMLRIVKKDGLCLITGPLFSHYEKFQFPSKFNSDHKCTFDFFVKDRSDNYRAPHIYIPDLKNHPVIGKYNITANLVDSGYNYMDDISDQTRAGAEAFFEILIKKI